MTHKWCKTRWTFLHKKPLLSSAAKTFQLQSMMFETSTLHVRKKWPKLLWCWLSIKLLRFRAFRAFVGWHTIRFTFQFPHQSVLNVLVQNCTNMEEVMEFGDRTCVNARIYGLLFLGTIIIYWKRNKKLKRAIVNFLKRSFIWIIR